jgi:Co/Zn/Cd efflux system component
VGVGLNLIFVATEVAFGVLAASTALLADAAHNFSDVLGLPGVTAAHDVHIRAMSNHGNGTDGPPRQAGRARGRCDHR